MLRVPLSLQLAVSLHTFLANVNILSIFKTKKTLLFWEAAALYLFQSTLTTENNGQMTQNF
jgi:hypothetical protein